MKTMEEIMALVDSLFDENKAKEAEALLLETLQEARLGKNPGMQLQLLNELIGYYRQTSETPKLTETIHEALAVAGLMGLEGTIPYATTALNAANGYRAVGETQKAMELYEVTEQIYREKLDPMDMLYAGLYNNRSLLYQELGSFGLAKECLERALNIVTEHQAGFEIAVTNANLANTCYLAEEYAEAKQYAMQAIALFEERNTLDAHYCAALSALGMCLVWEEQYNEAAAIFARAMEIVENSLGKNKQYQRLMEQYAFCTEKLKQEQEKKNINSGKLQGNKEERQPMEKGLQICRRYYEEYGKPMIREKFPEYVGKIAVGLVGFGSDCFGLDDVYSRDHDWGPGFCMWVSKETYEAIGQKLEEAYEELPKEFEGYVRAASNKGGKRVGVFITEEFYESLIGTGSYETIDWNQAEDASLAAAVNGQVYIDEEGVFTAFREKLMQGYPEAVQYLKIARAAAAFSQAGQYNYGRVLKRGDRLTADRMLSDAMGHAMRLWHYILNIYPLHDKWLAVCTEELPGGRELLSYLKALHSSYTLEDNVAEQVVTRQMERLGQWFADKLYERSFISDIEPYLDFHVEELLHKGNLAGLTDKELVELIAKLEFKAFDKVQNEGGRASCQNNWPTFRIMRVSQYLTWNREMLLQYHYDFDREFRKGHNLITEKYGRMMESTAPERYREIEANFPVLSEQKKAIIEQIVEVQMNMVEEVAKTYPKVVGNARDLHTYEDNPVNTSYETYLRGEISTYSDKMLQLYGAYVVEYIQAGKNIAQDVMTNTARLYGFRDMEEFEKAL